MSQTKTFKLIVTVTDNCLEICRYLDKNIVSVNKLGAKVHIEKISKAEFDESMVESLRKKGITRLPTLVTPDNKLFIGLKSIRDLFEKNLRNMRTGERVGPINEFGGPAASAEMGSNPDLTEWWTRELFEGYDPRRRAYVPRKDEDENEEENAEQDIQRRLADYNRNVPKHRRAGAEREREIDFVPRQRRRRAPEPDPEDNIDSDDDDQYPEYDEPQQRPTGRATRVSLSGDARGDDMDQRMLAAWLDNNPADN